MHIENYLSTCGMSVTDSYAPSNFTLTNTNADGSVNTSSSPDFISITDGNNGNGFGFTQFLTLLLPLDWLALTGVTLHKIMMARSLIHLATA